MCQSQQQTQATDTQKEEIRISINLLYIKGTGKKLWYILKSHTVTSFFYTESTLCKLLCKPKDWVVVEDKNGVYEIDFSTCEAIYFSEFRQSLKLRLGEHMIFQESQLWKEQNCKTLFGSRP